MSLLLLFSPRATGTPTPQPTPAVLGGGGAAAILRAAWREQRIKQDDKDLMVLIPALQLVLRGGR